MVSDTSKSVDDIWTALKRNSGVNTEKMNKVWSQLNKETIAVKKKTEAVVISDVATICSSRPNTNSTASTLGKEAEPDPAVLLQDFDGTFETFNKLVQRDLNCLMDTNSRTRIKSLLRVKALVSAKEELLNPEVLMDAVSQLFLKPLLRRLEDPVEKCRELAASTLLSIVANPAIQEVVLELLPYVLPVLGDRLALQAERPDPTEPSEEIRFRLCQLLTAIVTTSESGISPYASDIADIAETTCKDASPDVLMLWAYGHESRARTQWNDSASGQQESCAYVGKLATILVRRLQPVAHKLVFTITPILDFKRSKVRVECLKALNKVMHCGAHETILDLSSFRSPNIVKVQAFYGDDIKVNWFGKMGTDSVPSVREEFVRCMGDWLLNLHEREDHQARLIPSCAAPGTRRLYCLGAGVQASLHCLSAGVQASLYCLGAGVQASLYCLSAGVQASLHCLSAGVQASLHCLSAGVQASLYC
ncbi:hypothetical protein CYMTET_33864, partial [Cymbomonas tetramitiformis]